MPRLYLTDRNIYRVRTRTGCILRVSWADDAGTFRTRAGDLTHDVAWHDVAAVTDCLDGHTRCRWTPLDACFRAVHAPKQTAVPWVHPYARR